MTYLQVTMGHQRSLFGSLQMQSLFSTFLRNSTKQLSFQGENNCKRPGVIAETVAVLYGEPTPGKMLTVALV